MIVRKRECSVTYNPNLKLSEQKHLCHKNLLCDKQFQLLQGFAPSKMIEKPGLDFNSGPYGKRQQQKQTKAH